MALLFSTVNVTVGNYDVDFLVGGIPRELDDLFGWAIFDDFMEEIDNDTTATVTATAYLYGEGETVQATPEEVAYFMKRLEVDPKFLSEHCDCTENTEFFFTWDSGDKFCTEL